MSENLRRQVSKLVDQEVAEIMEQTEDPRIPVVFYALADSSRYVHFGVRTTAEAA
ncbi:hypothetical protein [Streptomyces sp. AcE210]|uniref:hypothetical protein n=1 Tax=Streptomyces sp. AcE210 TaxID=2292703 RepID=UPI0014047EE2|nr:hypothetical protein [Streptomyces sp. AcE210]